MDFDAPFTAQLVEQDNTKLRKLQLSFPQQFQQLDVEAQGVAMQDYIQELHQHSYAAEAGSSEQQGMLIVLQIAEQMLPHIQAGEMELSQMIEVEVVSEGGAEPESGPESKQAGPTVLGQPLWHELDS